MSSTTLTSLAVAAPRIPATARRTFRRAAATPAPRRGDGIARRAAETSYENGTIDLELSTEEARATLQFDKFVVRRCSRSRPSAGGVAIGSAAEAAGVVPGQRLVALSDPINDGKLWFLDGSERLQFVVDAIRSTRAYEMKIVVETEVSITKTAVDAARPPQPPQPPPPQQQQQQQQREKVAAADLAPKGSLPPPEKLREREDLYSENWAGDEYVGGEFWNELTVGIAIFVAVPTIITVVATASRGVLWDTATF